MISNKDLDLSWVNSIKGISIIGVFLVHTYSQLPLIANFSPFSMIAVNGRLGAHVFYLLSGFLMCVSYYKKTYATKKVFFVRKAMRLLPLVWIVSFLKYTAIGGYTNKVAIVASLFFADVIYPRWWGYIHNGWVSVLVLLYFLFVLFIDRVNTLKKAIAVAFIAWYGSIIGWYLLKLTHDEIIANWGGYILLGIRNFAFGILLYYILINYQNVLKQQPKYKANLLLLVSLSYLFIHIVFDKCLYLENIYAEFVLAIVVIIISLVILKNKVLINPMWDFFGKYSYGIFLLHLTLPGCFPSLEFSNPYLNVLVLFGISVLGSYGFYHMIEKPLLQYIDKKVFKRILEK